MPFSRRPFTGFPFNDDRVEGTRSFESELEDIANRHPNFAEHLRPFASTTGAIPRQNRFSSPRRRFEEPFSSRLRDFRFPFGPEDDFDQNLHYPQERPTQFNPPQQPNHSDTCDSRESQPKTESKQKANIQQSNTVDLGQKQEPVDDNRHQRSMSAPPENSASSGRRFVSSINIPNINAGIGDMGSKMSQPEAPQPQNKPKERIIPIHIEGRDEPVIPKNPNISFSGPPPQTERIFGQRPSTFTQFVNKEEPQVHHYQGNQYQQPPQQHQFQQQHQQQSQHCNEPPRTEEVHQEEVDAAQASAPPPPVPKPTPLEIIQNIQRDVSDLMNQVENFDGKPKDKQYKYLDEMLTRNLIKLDGVDTEGKDAIRQARKEAIKCIEECIRILETKANANESANKNEEGLALALVKMEADSQEITKEEAVNEENTQKEVERNEDKKTEIAENIESENKATAENAATEKEAPENKEAQKKE